MKKVIMLMISLIMICCNEGIEKDTPYNYEKYGSNLTNKLNLLGENLRNNNKFFNDSNSVKKALHEVFGENSKEIIAYNKKILHFKTDYQKRMFNNKTIKPRNILVDEIRNLLLKSNNINEYKEELYKLFNKINKTNTKKQETHNKLIYLQTQIAFIDFISFNPDLFPPPILSNEKYSQRSINNMPCRRNAECPRGMICCQGYCRYPTASDMCPSWLGVLWGVALVEPTPIGEGISTVVTGVVGGYYALTRSECIAEYVNCKYRNTDENCSRCLQFCIVQGYWCN